MPRDPKPDRKLLGQIERAAISGELNQLQDYLTHMASPAMPVNHTRETVLHLAAKNDRIAVVEYFAELTDTLTAKNIRGKLPEDVAEGRSATYLRHRGPIKRAIQTAKDMYPDNDAEERDAAYNAIVRDNQERYATELQPLINGIVGRARDRNRTEAGGQTLILSQEELEQVQTTGQYYGNITEGLFRILTALRTTQEAGFKDGRCGLRALAAAAHLLCRENMRSNIYDALLNVEGVGGHEFLVIAFDPTKTLAGQFNDRKNGYLLVCDAYSGEFYSSLNIPNDTSVQLLRNSRTDVTLIPCSLPHKVNEIAGYSFFKEEWDRMITEIDRLLPPRVVAVSPPPPPPL